MSAFDCNNYSQDTAITISTMITNSIIIINSVVCVSSIIFVLMICASPLEQARRLGGFGGCESIRV